MPVAYAAACRGAYACVGEHGWEGAMAKLAMPDGIRKEHAEHRRGLKHQASMLGMVVLSVLMLFALLGFFGAERTRVLAQNGVEVSWHGPAVIRNGEFLEIRMDV